MFQVNLLPWRKKHQRHLLNRLAFIFICYAGLSITSIALFQQRLNTENHQLLNVINQVTQKDIAVSAAIARRKENQRQLAVASERVELFSELEQQSKRNIQLLILITHWLPERAWLEKVSIHQQNITIEGRSKDYSSIVIFTNEVKRYSELRQANLISVTRSKIMQSNQPATLDFKLEAIWK